jgi:hypothetical protein
MATSSTNPIVQLLSQNGQIYAREPGIVVVRAMAFDDLKTAFYSIVIWGRLKLYAHVGEKNG